MNKKGQKNNTLIIVIVAGVILYFLWSSGAFNGSSGTNQASNGLNTQSGVQYPSDLKSTVALSFKDDLATSETVVNASWYAFNGNGLYFASGTASAGASTLYANVDSHYDIWAYKSGGESVGYLPKKFTVTTTNKPNQAETIRLVKLGGLTPSNWFNEALNSNATVGTAGTTEGLKLRWKSNVSNAGTMNPIILLETNGTTYVETISVTGDNKGGTYSVVACPDRKTASVTGHQIKCFQRNSIAYAADGLISTDVNLKFAATAPDDSAWLQATMLDTSMYLNPGYSSISDVMFGGEDGSDTDVGASDSATLRTYFNG
jgi:hypothetical protein